MFLYHKEKEIEAMTIQRLEKQLMKLDVASRAKLANRLLLSLEELSEAENEALWAQEAYLRHKEATNGKPKLRSAAIVFKNAHARLK
jgi:hypothetical protein